MDAVCLQKQFNNSLTNTTHFGLQNGEKQVKVKEKQKKNESTLI